MKWLTSFEMVAKPLGLIAERADSRISSTSSAGRLRNGLGGVETRDNENLRGRKVVLESVVVRVAMRINLWGLSRLNSRGPL